MISLRCYTQPPVELPLDGRLLEGEPAPIAKCVQSWTSSGPELVTSDADSAVVAGAQDSRPGGGNLDSRAAGAGHQPQGIPAGLRAMPLTVRRHGPARKRRLMYECCSR